jgi:peptidyl-prolyl cis-trans isomerase SurA
MEHMKTQSSLPAQILILMIFLWVSSSTFAAYEGPLGELADRVVAKVNNTAITLSELEEAVVERRLGDPQAQKMTRRELYEEELARLIDDELIYDLAMQNKIEAPDEMVAARVKEVVTNLEKTVGSRDQLNEFLAAQGLTLEKLQQIIGRREKKQIAIVRAISSRFTLTESDVKEFERELHAKGQAPVGYHLRQILIRCPKDAPPQEAKRAREHAFQVALEVQQGLAFEDAARQYSDDSETAPLGGDLGYVSEGSMMPTLEQAIRALKVGQISQPVRSETGFHVFKLENIRSTRKILFAKRFEEERQNMVNELRRTQTIETQMEFLKDIPESQPTRPVK